MGIWEGIKAASKVLIEGPGPGQFVARGKEISCPHCGHNGFIETDIVLSHAAKSSPFIDFGKSAVALVCNECGRIELFTSAPNRQ